MKTRLTIIAVFLLLVSAVFAIGILNAATNQAAHKPPMLRAQVVRCAPLARRMHQFKESFYGLIEAEREVDMAFQIAGRVSLLGSESDELEENDLVRKGQQLAMLEPDRYRYSKMIAEAGMQEAQAAMAEQSAQLADAKARLVDAEQNLERAKALAAQNAVNVRDVEERQRDYDVAKAAVDAAQARLEAAEARYNVARHDFNIADIAVQDATLPAPRDAIVAQVSVEVGQMVQPGEAIVKLVDIGTVKLVLGVVESKLPLLEQGQEVFVHVDALRTRERMLGDGGQGEGHIRRGVVTMVPPSASETGLFNVEVRLDNADGKLRPGMIGLAEVLLAERPMYVIPADAAVRDGRRIAAFFVSTGYEVGLDLGDVGRVAINVPRDVARRIYIDQYTIDKDAYLIEQAPPGAQRLVIEGQSRLADNQPVLVVSDAQASAAP